MYIHYVPMFIITTIMIILCIYIYIYIHMYESYIYIYVCVYIYIYIHKYIVHIRRGAPGARAALRAENCNNPGM